MQDFIIGVQVVLMLVALTILLMVMNGLKK